MMWVYEGGRNGLRAPYSHPHHSASTKITESHSASILTPTQPQSNLLSPPYQARLGLLDTTPNHIWHLGNVSFFHCLHDPKFTNFRLPHYVTACLIFETWNWKVAPSFNFSVVLPAISMASGHIVRVARWPGGVESLCLSCLVSGS